MKIDLALKGFETLTAQLAKLADENTTNSIVRHAYREGAKPILAAAKANCPVDTGFGKANLKIKPGKRKKGFVSVLVGEGSYRGDTFYLAMVEYGHASKGNRHVPAHPFMRPAVDSQKANAEQIITREIAAGIAAAMKS